MKTAAAVAWVLGLLVLAYGGSLRNPLLYDDRTLVDTRWIQEEVGPVRAFATGYWHGTRHPSAGLYRPLTVLSVAANARLAGGRAGFRGANLVLHGLFVAALFVVGAKVTGSRFAAMAGAVLFAAHPLGSEAVFWIVGRAEILAALLGTLALAFLLGAEERAGRPAALLRLASVAAWFLALLAKESAACWLVLLPAGWVLLTGRRGGIPRGFALWGPYAAAFAVYLVLRGAAVGWHVEAPHFVDNPLVELPAVTRAFHALVLLGAYAAKFLWPATLSIDYGFDQIPVRPPWPWAAPAALLLIVLWVAALTLAVRRGRGPLAFLLLWVPGAFAVTGNVFLPIGTILADRLAYLPLAGGCLLAGITLDAAARRRREVALLVLAAATLAGALRVRSRGEDYRNVQTLSEATVAASPRSVKALANAGRNRLRIGNPEGAVELLERAVTIWPDYARAWLSLSEAYAAAGRPDDAARAEGSAREAASRASGLGTP